MGVADMGELIDVGIEAVWEHEAHDFTPWLACNIDKLAAELGMQLEVEGKEVRVGSLRADIVCRVPTDGSRVLIENQLWNADLHHLGQVMAYLAGLEANTVVWVARGFDEAHLSAFRWLNEHTPDDIAFFAVKVRAVRIGESLPAPVFEVVERPNEWNRQVRQESQGISELGKLRQDFWAHYRDRHSKAPGPPQGFAGSNVNHPILEGDLRLSLYLAKDGAGVFTAPPFGKPSGGTLEKLTLFLKRLRSELEKEDGPGQIYGPKHDSRIVIDGYNRANWDKIADWLESRRKIYMRVLSTAPGDGEGATTDAGGS